MLAWNEFAKLPADQFGPRATEIAQRLANPAAGVNAVLRNELAKRPAPKNLGEVAAIYGDVFAACIAGKEPDNDDWKQVRALLAEPGSPMSVGVEGVDQFFTRKDHEHMTKFDNEMKRLELSEPGAPLRAMVLTDTPQAARRARLHPRQSRAPGRSRAARLAGVPRRTEVHLGQRPAGACAERSRARTIRSPRA